MKTYIADADGHIDAPGITTIYPVGATVYLDETGAFAGMEMPEPESKPAKSSKQKDVATDQ